MSARGFAGGVHPPDSKELTRDKSIELLSLPERVVIPLHQHIGAPSVALVEVGAHVKKGQVIASARGYVSSPIHASISGEVKAIKEFPHPSGKDMMAIEIVSDGKDEWAEDLEEEQDVTKLSAQDIRGKVLSAGIVGLGGAAFPTHVKLAPPDGKKIEAVILNGAECEPYLTADHRLMVEDADSIIEGLKLLMKVLGVNKGYIGIEDNKPEAVTAMMTAASGTDIEVMSLHVKYPQGAEKQLIKAVIGKEVPPGGLPMDVGVVVQNVGTAAAVYDAVRYGRPLIERITTVTGLGVKEPKNFKVRIGTLSGELIDAAGGFTENIGKIIMGGPMMGGGVYTTDVPVVKGTSGILVMKMDEIRNRESHPCIRCGRCAAVCPMYLEPGAMGIFSEREMLEEVEDYFVMDCIECGCCSYTCPSDRPLVQLFRFAKAGIIKKRQKEGDN
ncbi:MAG: electron transport complex subunit RsxC [Deltaproteobacteria bacterium]|nr:electron transport complex subunit RsxC [Deltaproteobacteria bacterium]